MLFKSHHSITQTECVNIEHLYHTTTKTPSRDAMRKHPKMWNKFWELHGIAAHQEVRVAGLNTKAETSWIHLFGTTFWPVSAVQLHLNQFSQHSTPRNRSLYNILTGSLSTEALGQAVTGRLATMQHFTVIVSKGWTHLGARPTLLTISWYHHPDCSKATSSRLTTRQVNKLWQQVLSTQPWYLQRFGVLTKFELAPQFCPHCSFQNSQMSIIWNSFDGKSKFDSICL